MKLLCHSCERRWAFDVSRWRCECGGVLEVVGGPGFDPALVREGEYSLWRYREALPLARDAELVTLGEGWTPLVAVDWEGEPIRIKVESLNPTGSFKDRGAALLVTAIRAAGAEEDEYPSVVDDSSGNAGAALSAYAAHAGLDATIYVPAHASSAKRAQIAVYGAEIVTVSGSRSDTTRAMLRVVKEGDGRGSRVVYASHAHSPLYAQGMKTVAYELWEQCGGCAPDRVVVPVGHGGLLLGLHAGFDDLLASGLIERRPRLVGVQAEACAPLARAWEKGAKKVKPVEEGETVAGGVRIASPPWGHQVLDAVRQSDGAIVAVSDEEALIAQRKLARRGFYVEPTSALAVAALGSTHLASWAAEDGVCGPQRVPGARKAPPTVVILTGSGLKSPAH